MQKGVEPIYFLFAREKRLWNCKCSHYFRKKNCVLKTTTFKYICELLPDGLRFFFQGKFRYLRQHFFNKDSDGVSHTVGILPSFLRKWKPFAQTSHYRKHWGHDKQDKHIGGQGQLIVGQGEIIVRQDQLIGGQGQLICEQGQLIGGQDLSLVGRVKTLVGRVNTLVGRVNSFVSRVSSLVGRISHWLAGSRHWWARSTHWLAGSTHWYAGSTHW